MAIVHETESDKGQYLVVLTATVVSITSFLYYLRMHAVTAFSDGQARLVIARSITDNLTPTLWMNGGIWLPFPQLAMALTARFDPFYESGGSGAIISMVSFVTAAFFIYKMVRIVTKDNLASFVGALAIMTPSMLYIQSTPMSESMFNAFFAGSVYYLAKWFYHEKDTSIAAAGLMLFCAVMTRYEAWVLLGCISFCYLIGAWSMHFRKKRRILATYIYLVFLPVMAIFGWIVFNGSILHDPLYFFRSEYAPWAFAQKAIEQMPENERTAGNMALSIKVFTKTTIDTVGYINTALGVCGIALMLAPLLKPALAKIKINARFLPDFFMPGRAMFLFFCCLLLPYPFYVLSIYQGGSVIILHPDFTDGVNWGTRYGVHTLPAAGFFIGFFASKIGHLKYLVIPAMAVSFVITWQAGNLSLDEALVNNQNGPDASIQRAAGDWLVANYDSGHILMQHANNTATVFRMTPEIKIRDFVYENNGQVWEDSLNNPVGNRWVIMRRSVDGNTDRVWQTLHDSPIMALRYDLVYNKDGVMIFKLREGG
ncbi:MAG: ArnT family glycosyltransferase [Dehalococcoidia bacterium]